MMPRVPVHTIDDAPGQSREALRGLERRMSRLLNIHAEMAHAPVVLAAYQGIQKAITQLGSFDARTREAIALAVGAVNECAYCQSAHTAGGQAAGWSLEETVAIREGTADFGPELGSLLAVAREIAGNTGYVADATWQAAREASWSDAELAELFAHVAANMFTNYFNHYVQTEPDLPAAPGLEGWSPRG
jgi:AhpD family alkylhydroperoxidase